jgi:predicted RNA-binding protein with PIN domain
MPILIDGYNLLHLANIVVEEGGDYTLEKSRRAVLRFVRSIVPTNELSQTTVVFDGREAPPGLKDSATFGPIKVRFSKRGTEADDLIEELVPTYSVPKSLVVVSSDHRVQRAARRRGARGVDCEVWVRELLAKRRQSQSLPHRSTDPGEAARVEQTSEERDGWLLAFGAIDIAGIELEISESKPDSDLWGTPSREGATDSGSESSDIVEDADEADEELDDFFDPFPEGYGEDLLG